jgi:Domain of unknown function (DUF4234)
MNNIYESPQSNLIDSNNEGFEIFTRFSTWYVIGLSIITLSFYIPYWLYTRSKKLNAITTEPISVTFMILSIVIYVTSFAVIFIEDFIPTNTEIIFRLYDFIANVLIIVWTFMFRNRMQGFALSHGIKVGGVFTFLFQIYYLQYKINEILGNTQKKSTL